MLKNKLDPIPMKSQELKVNPFKTCQYQYQPKSLHENGSLIDGDHVFDSGH